MSFLICQNVIFNDSIFRLGYFKRSHKMGVGSHTSTAPSLIFNDHQRRLIDNAIDRVSGELVDRGHAPLPTHLYTYYRQSSAKILSDSVHTANTWKAEDSADDLKAEPEGLAPNTGDLVEGAKMLIGHFKKWFSGGKNGGSFLERLVLNQLTRISEMDFVGGEEGERIITMILDILPSLKQSWSTDPLTLEIRRLRGNQV